MMHRTLLLLLVLPFSFAVATAQDVPKKVEPEKGSKQGWFTSQITRPILLQAFTDAVAGGWLKINSPMCRRQAAEWVRTTASSGKTKFQHDPGKHDDNLFAVAMAYFTVHAMDAMGYRSQTKYQNPVEKNPPLNRNWFENTMSVE